jgi:hypothetical protein
VAEPRIVQLPAAKLARLSGRYEGGRRPLRVVFHQGRLWVRKGPERVELLPVSETVCLEKDSDTRFTFALGEGKAAGLRVQVLGAPEARYLARTGDEEEPATVALGAAQLDACAGVYEPAPGVRVRYRRDGTRFFCDDPDEGPIELEAVAPDRFRVKGSAIRVEFLRGADGKVVEVVTAFDERSVRARRMD